MCLSIWSCAAVPVKDTIKLLTKLWSSFRQRYLWAAQTLKHSNRFDYGGSERARASGFIGTDDASWLKRWGKG